MLVNNELQKLVLLQDFELKIKKAHHTIQAAPFILKPLQNEIARIEKSLVDLEEKKAGLDKKILDLENAVKSDAIYADSMEVKMPTLLSNHKEYHMVAKTIDKLRKLGKDRQAEILQLKEKREKVQERLAAYHQEKSEIETDLNAKKNEVEEQLKEAQQDITEAQSERERCLETVAPQILQKYQRLAQAYGHGVGLVKEKRCSSCDVVVPPQTFNLLQRGEEVQQCPNCQRLLYLIG